MQVERSINLHSSILLENDEEKKIALQHLIEIKITIKCYYKINKERVFFS